MPYHYLKEAGLRPEQDVVCSFHDERAVSSEGSDEAAVVELVAAGEFDAGAVSGRTIAVLRAQGRFSDDRLRVFWSSPGYRHYYCSGQARMDDALAQKVTRAFLTMSYGHAEHRQILDLEHCSSLRAWHGSGIRHAGKGR